MRNLFLSLGVVVLLVAIDGCGCSGPAPAAPEPTKAPPANARDAAVQGLEAREALLGETGATGSKALQQTLDLRDGLNAQQQEATRAAGGE
jgi:predicted small lipoprotein YifL